MKKIIVFLFLISVQFATAQRPRKTLKAISSDDNRSLNANSTNYDDASSFGNNKSNSTKKNENAKITDYLIISHKSDTTYVDTTLSLKKNYKFNYLRKDNFELMPFSNLGQTYNTLGYSFSSTRLMPQFAARSKHFNYMEVDDINYYHVPTPLTELFFKTAFQQGQLLDAFFTTNTSKQFNISIGYKGLRSLGKYQHILSSSGNFRATASYKTKNNRYVANAHFASQDILNQENGGLLDSNVPFFINGQEDLIDRARLEVNFEDAEGKLEGRRTYLNHHYKLLNQSDSLSKNEIRIGHIFNLEDKNYGFTQSRQNDYFGASSSGTNLIDRVKLERLYNEVNASYVNNTIGFVKFGASHTNYNYGYNSIIVNPTNTITNRLKGDVVALNGSYKKVLGGFNVEVDLGANITGDFNGNYFLGKAAYNFNDDISFKAAINNHTVAPNFNAQLYQSRYSNYNWANKFNSIKTQQLDFEAVSKKWGSIALQTSTINDYVFFAENPITNQVEAFQNNKVITYLKLTARKDIRYRHFGLDNTIQYQKVDDENKVFNVPEVIVRSTLYYEDFAFKKAMTFQTGITFNYFTKYHMNAYNPLLSEFYIQTDQEIGGFPRLDFFVDAKIRQARLFLKAEHFNAAFTGREYFSAPNYPYRDFTIRFGLVWDFFL